MNSPVLKIQHTRDIQYLSDINLDVWPYRVQDLTLGLVFGSISVLRPSTHFKSFQARSVTLTTFFLGKPPRQLTST